MIVQCAWCKRPLGTTPDEPRHAITHSICRYCKVGAKASLRRQRVKATQKKRYAMRRSFMGNPGGHIPGEVIEVRYRRGRAGYYKHEFKPGVKQRRLRPGQSFTSRHNAVVLYHNSRPVWEDERTPGFWDRYGHGGNPGMARRRQSKMGQYLLWGGLAYLAYYYFTSQPVSTGGANQVIPQPAGTLWYADPFQQDPSTGMAGDQSFFIGSLPPGASPPWRLASAQEIQAMNLGMQAGTLVAAGGGLIVHA